MEFKTISELLGHIKRLDGQAKQKRSLDDDGNGKALLSKLSFSPLRKIRKIIIKARILLLGMFRTKDVFKDPEKSGQGYRDALRADVLENIFNCEVRSVDNKHDESDYGLNKNKHIRANFCDVKRMLKDIRIKWGWDISFQEIFLDYFNCPVSSKLYFFFIFLILILLSISLQIVGWLY
jgi:hypothetical protein